MNGCATVSQNMTKDWVRFYEWSDSTSKKFTGRFTNVEDAINAVPQDIKIIKVQITDNDGKEINYIINRDNP